MSLFVRVTDECRKSAERHGALDFVLKLAEQVEAEQSDEMFEKSPKPFMVRKNIRRRAGRLLAVKRFTTISKQNHAVIVFLRLMMYDADHYDQKVCMNAQAFYDAEFKQSLDMFDVEGYVRERLSAPAPEPKKRLDKSEERFLYDSTNSGTTSLKDMICESRNWIKAVFEPELKDKLPRVRDALEMIYNAGAEGDGSVLKFPVPKTGNGEMFAKNCTRHDNEKDLDVYYQWVKVEVLREDGEGVGYEHVLFLCDVNVRGAEVRGSIPPEDLSAACEYFYRMYPYYILSGDNMWSCQEREQYGNFALSKEEAEAIAIPKGKRSVPFPLFINGRAGSGKSTVLAYVFADYFARFLKMRHEGIEIAQPVYFACSGALLDKAKEMVSGILRNNSGYQVADESMASLMNDGRFASAFLVFRDFLISLIQPGDGDLLRRVAKTWQPGGLDSRYIDFGRFREMWNAFPDRDTIGCGPDLCWHVIRTYIKGWSAAGLIDNLDELIALLSTEDGGSDLVKSGVVKKIFEKVWMDWYKPLTAPEDGDGAAECFDDQDLVRYVLNNRLIEERKVGFSGVFADEAQDFTRCELKSILKMSKYSSRKIGAYQLENLPFVFAGDEFQTLNPTGFSWKLMRTNFVETLLEELCPEAENPTVNYRDLIHNYRSRNNIVKVGNAVQLDRAQCLGLRDLRPQIPWRKMMMNAGNKVFYYNTDVQGVWAAFKSLDVDKALVLPCLPTEVDGYIEGHADLKENVENRPDGSKNPPVFSVVEAKGLDFDACIVYGFGEEYASRFAGCEKATARGEFVEWSFFLNRLYVAVTRPKESLVIVDGATGYDDLWKRYESTKTLLEGYKSRFGAGGHLEEWTQVWEMGLKIDDEVFTLGDPEQARKVFGEDYIWDPEGTAKKYAEVGRRERSAKLMLLAAQWYGRCKGEDFHRKSVECSAEAATYNRDLRRAAELYASVGDYERACDCWWKVRDFRGLAEVPLLDAEKYPHPFRFEFARAYESGTAVALARVADAVVRGRDDEVFDGLEWSAVLSRLAEKISKAKDVDDEAASRLVALVAAGYVSAKPSTCENLVDAGRYAAACRLYDLGKFNLQEVDAEKYRLAHYKTADFATVWSYLPEKGVSDAEVSRHLVELYLKADLNGRILPGYGEDQRKRIVKAFAETEGLQKVTVELHHIMDGEWMRELAKSIRGERARQALLQGATILKYERMTHTDAVNSLISDLKPICKDCGRDFAIRLLSRVTGLPAGTEMPRMREFAGIAEPILNPLGLVFGANLPQDEFCVAFDRYYPKALRDRYPGYVSKTHDLLSRDWEYLRNDVLSKEAFAVDAVKGGDSKEGNQPCAELAEVNVEHVPEHDDEVGAGSQSAVASDAVEENKSPKPIGASVLPSAKMTLRWGDVEASYVPRKGKVTLKLRKDNESFEYWAIDANGIEVDDEQHDPVERMPLGDAGVMFTANRDFVRLESAEDGSTCLFEVRFT